MRNISTTDQGERLLCVPDKISSVILRSYRCGGFAAVTDELAEAATLEAGVFAADVELPAAEAVDDVSVALGLGCDTGFGASTPAVLDPRPSFCKLRASIFPLGFMPLSD